MTAVIALLKNKHNNHFHPIIFKSQQDNRYRSMGHHTEGFRALEAAVAHCKTVLLPFVQKNVSTEVYFCLDSSHEWDTKTAPALVVMFSSPDSEGNVKWL